MRTQGFSLIELLIVVVIMGILAAVAVPQFTNVSSDAKISSLTTNLSSIRSQIEFYRVQHNDVNPGYPAGGGAPTEAVFTDQMRLASRQDGTTAALGTAGFPLGPYLKKGMPKDPYNGLATVEVIADGQPIPAGDDSHGWLYKPQTGEFLTDSASTTSDGTPVDTF
ncbi:MAG: prepilin-type N-terminal cleavage/methylation domain-containing protein [Planctomycetes bacterium]|nr:prepilin-type N-terminal cleavage/methylation domain-containing protein [Planctomycetota bacterium]